VSEFKLIEALSQRGQLGPQNYIREKVVSGYNLPQDAKNEKAFI